MSVPYKLLLLDGTFALIDEEDRARVEKRRWFSVQSHSNNSPYVASVQENGLKSQRLHRFILGFVEGDPDIDHKDRDGLNNCKENLRPATAAQNAANYRRTSVSTSVFRGVSWHKRRNKWVAHIKVDGRQKHLGVFDDEFEAALAWNTAAVAVWGEFVLLNDIPV